MFKVGFDKFSDPEKYRKELDILQNLQMIPDAKHPLKKKITSFIRKHCKNNCF